MADANPPEPRRGLGRGVLAHLKHKLGAGLLVMVPLGTTIFILRFLFRLADGFLAPYLKKLGEFRGNADYVPGVGAVTGIIVVYLVGLVATNVIGHRLVHAWNDLLSRIPLVKSIHLSARQLMEVLAGKERNPFRQAVYVDFPLEGVFAIAFITAEMLTPSGKRYYNCFVPTSPNPTSGFVLVLPEEEICPAGISVEEAMKIIVSGGMVAPEMIAASRLQ